MTIKEGNHYNGENTPDYEICENIKGQAEWTSFYIGKSKQS